LVTLATVSVIQNTVSIHYLNRNSLATG